MAPRGAERTLALALGYLCGSPGTVLPGDQRHITYFLILFFTRWKDGGKKSCAAYYAAFLRAYPEVMDMKLSNGKALLMFIMRFTINKPKHCNSSPQSFCPVEHHLASNIQRSRLVQHDLQVAKQLQEEDLRAQAQLQKRYKDL